MLTTEVQQYWDRLVQSDEADWRLAEAALMFAKQVYPQLEPQAYLEKLDELAKHVESDGDASPSVEQRVERINHVLFDEFGLRGNQEAYYEPENSYLNMVLDRKLGIPISLSVIYMDVAAQVGLETHGINFPGHFLVRIENGDEPIVIDAFESGKQIDDQELKARWATANETPAPAFADTVAQLQPASKRQVLVRMLRNLKNIYIEKQQAAEGLVILELILRLQPESPDDLRDRGMIYHHLEYTPAALADLNRYLELVPEGPERPAVEALVDSLQEQNTSVH